MNSLRTLSKTAAALAALSPMPAFAGAPPTQIPEPGT